MLQRKRCEYENCNKYGRNKGRRLNKIIFGRFCEKHHRMRCDYSVSHPSSISNLSCERCGWKESFCDRHRINKNIGYVKENVLVLCPNCHRIETSKLST